MTEAIPVYATALLPVTLLPLLGATSFRSAAAPYAHEMVFLFLGGFLLARAIARWGVDRRMALFALRQVGPRMSHLVAAVMAVTAFLSMWVSNTATAMVMLPIVASLQDFAREEPAEPSRGGAGTPATPNFTVCSLLGVAYGATIGGVGTLIGTPPNLFLASFARDALGIEIGFVRWMAVGVPLVVVSLPLTWWLLTHRLFPVHDRDLEGVEPFLREARASAGPPQRAEKLVFGVFALTATAWILRPLLPGAPSDASIALVAGVCLFVVPVSLRKRVFLLDWEAAKGLPWGVLVLFGGGLSLAAAIRANGVDHWLGAQITAGAELPGWAVVLCLTAGVIFLTELTSNTATAATLIPLLAAIAPGLGLSPLHLIVPAALASSYAFMLPVATPPNAIVFGARRLRVAEMCRAGIWLNLGGVLLITALTYGLALPLLGAP